VSEEIFAEILREAAADSQRRVRFIESRTQSRDHPVLLTHPESKYLKCVALEAA
jgi:23S rRNA (cytosine1962-C5)-methyltransferase